MTQVPLCRLLQERQAKPAKNVVRPYSGLRAWHRGGRDVENTTSTAGGAEVRIVWGKLWRSPVVTPCIQWQVTIFPDVVNNRNSVRMADIEVGFFVLIKQLWRGAVEHFERGPRQVADLIQYLGYAQANETILFNPDVAARQW